MYPDRELKLTYEALDIGSYESNLQIALKKYFADRTGYKTNTFVLDPELCQKIGEKLGGVIKQYGYELVPVKTPSSFEEPPKNKACYNKLSG